MFLAQRGFSFELVDIQRMGVEAVSFIWELVHKKKNTATASKTQS